MPSASGIRAGKAYVELSVQEKNVVSKIQNRLADISSRLDTFSKNAAQKIKTFLNVNFIIVCNSFLYLIKRLYSIWGKQK